jgi:hypothetical protein
MCVVKAAGSQHLKQSLQKMGLPHLPWIQIALGAAAALDVLPRAFSGAAQAFPRLVKAPGGRDTLRRWGEMCMSLCVAVTLLTATSRTSAVLGYYQAPIKAWTAAYHSLLDSQHLSFTDPNGGQHACASACVGTEWHRFPSAFFLPEGSTLAFVDSSFDGAL